MKHLLLFTKSIGFLCLLIFISGFYKRPSNVILSEIKQGNNLDIRMIKDSIHEDSSATSYTLYKKNVHASYYHDKFNGRKTASGEKFDNNLFTAAHKTLKFGTKLKVTNPINNQFVIVTVNDRGPFVKNREIDLSKKAFMAISNHKLTGFINVHLEVLKE